MTAKRYYVLPVLASLGVASAICVVVDTNRSPPQQRPAIQAVVTPFASSVARAGVTEAGRGNIAIGTAVFGVVSDARAAGSALGSAKAQAAQIEVEIERSLARAPVPGRILQINTRAGEYVEGSGRAKTLTLLGDDARVYLRVDIDENEAWRIRPEAQARAFVRGNPQLQAALRFEYIEPHVALKTSTTGQSTERTDVRVLQVIYSFERSALPVYLGQQMDVFIEAPPVAQPGGASHR